MSEQNREHNDFNANVNPNHNAADAETNPDNARRPIIRGGVTQDNEAAANVETAAAQDTTPTQQFGTTTAADAGAGAGAGAGIGAGAEAGAGSTPIDTATEATTPTATWQQPSEPWQPEQGATWTQPIDQWQPGSAPAWTQTTPEQQYGYQTTPEQQQYGYQTTPEQAPGMAFGYPPNNGIPNDPQAPWQQPYLPPKKERKGPGWIALIASCLVTAGLTLGTAYLILPDDTKSASSLVQTSERKTPTVTPTPSSANYTDWEAVAKAVRPAVVAIQVSNGSSADDGSGVIFDNQGHVLTNHHVIANAVSGNGKIVISFTDGTLYAAKVVGSDPTTDLAVLKILNPPKDMVAAQLGTSNNLLVGQPIAAIGNPLGLSSTMTTGIISALNRPVVVRQKNGQNQDAQGDAVITNAIQVDASINPGNSGGPLFDATGKVIGINSSIASLGNSQDTAGSIGLGFAIPVDLAKMIAQQLIETGHAVHAYLGVSIIPGEGEANNAVRTGAEIRRVVANSPAAKAGLRPGDLVISIDDQQVGSGPALTGYIRRYPVGSKVKLTYIRNGQTNTVEATLAQAPTD